MSHCSAEMYPESAKNDENNNKTVVKDENNNDCQDQEILQEVEVVKEVSEESKPIFKTSESKFLKTQESTKTRIYFNQFLGRGFEPLSQVEHNALLDYVHTASNIHEKMTEAVIPILSQFTHPISVLSLKCGYGAFLDTLFNTDETTMEHFYALPSDDDCLPHLRKIALTWDVSRVSIDKRPLSDDVLLSIRHQFDVIIIPDISLVTDVVNVISLASGLLAENGKLIAYQGLQNGAFDIFMKFREFAHHLWAPVTTHAPYLVRFSEILNSRGIRHWTTKCPAEIVCKDTELHDNDRILSYCTQTHFRRLPIDVRYRIRNFAKDLNQFNGQQNLPMPVRMFVIDKPDTQKTKTSTVHFKRRFVYL